MAQSVSVVCASCGATLKVTKPSLIGKRVACPSCKQPLLIQPAPPNDELVPLSDDSGHKSLPASSNSGSAKPRSAEGRTASKSSSSSSKSSAGNGKGGGEWLPLADAPSDSLPVQVDADIDIPLLDPDHPRKTSAVPSSAGAKEAAKSAGPAPKKERRSVVWKQMEEAETAEFEAMLSDSDEESDELTAVEFPLNQGSRSNDAESGDFDTMLADTDAEQDEVTHEIPLQRQKRPQAAKGKKRRGADSDDFNVTVDDSVLDDDFGGNAPPPRRTGGGGSGRSRSNATQKLPLIIGAFVGCSILMGLLVYSVSGGHAPAPPPPTDANETSTAANEEPARPEAKTAAVAAVEPAQTKKPAVAAKDEAAAKVEAKESSTAADTKPDSAKTAQQPPLDGKALAAIGATAAAAKGAAGEGPIVGRQMAPFSATAVDNTTFQSAEHNEQVVVVAFLGVECPLANLYYPRLVELAKKYKGKSVSFLVVDSNAQDTLDGIQKQARINRAGFPVLKDAGHAVATAFGAERTPEVFVLDAQRTVRYHGMIDDQYGYGKRRAQPTKNYVVDAIDALLAGTAVATAETPVQGCHIVRTIKALDTAQTSYYRDVLPILQNRCQQCHRKGEIGPFALKSYAEARDWGPTIRDAVAERRMPPWQADPHVGKFSNDISLTDAEIQTISKWVDDGCPEGKEADKPAEKKFVDGWNIGKPDKVYAMSQPYHVPATGVIDYQNVIVSSVFAQDTWVQGVECRFGNRSVVHHMLVLLDFPKDHSKSQDGLVKGFFAAGAPGSSYFVFPKGYAKRIPKGARLRFQMHYTPNGSPADDQSRFGIVLAKGTGFREVQTYALGTVDINIPAGAADHRETATQNISGDVTLTTLMPHLHVRGKSFTFTVVYPDGKKQMLLSVPRWDFNWQPQYQLAEPIVLPKNSKIIVEAHWDNSADNPNNILPLVDVGFGEQTFDEMFIGYVNFIPKAMADATRTRGSRKRGG